MLSMHVATWPVSAEARQTLFALQLLGWTFRLDGPDREGCWVATALMPPGVRRRVADGPEGAVRALLTVLGEHEVMEQGWHVIARLPGRRLPADVATVGTREEAMARAMEMLVRRAGAEVFVVGFQPGRLHMTQEPPPGAGDTVPWVTALDTSPP